MTRPVALERARAIAAAKIAARFAVTCGGTDLDATLESLRGRIESARASSTADETAVADGIERALLEAGLSVDD